MPDEAERSLDPDSQRRAVRERYARIATDSDDDGGCCSDDDDGVGESTLSTEEAATMVGYSDEDVESAGEANLGLGCGNPSAITSLEPGETVVDLGSGAGFDCFLAADEVGESGQVIGVDMTPEMVEKARENASENGTENVEFRLGEIEHLPVADRSVDVVISNCVVNLSPDKPQVFGEAYRVLRPGGRLAISDVVLTADVPEELRDDPTAVASCVAGAATVERLESILATAGFEAVDVSPKDDGERIVSEWDEDRDLGEFVVAATVTGRKPDASGAETG